MAELHYKEAGAWRKATALWFRDGGAWRSIKEAWYRDGGVWRRVFAALAALMSPDFVYGYAGSLTAGDTVNATTDPTTLVVSGGSGSYTYAWAYVSGNPAFVVSATSATTVFKRGGTVPSVEIGLVTEEGIYRCTATDTASGATASATVTVITGYQNYT